MQFLQTTLNTREQLFSISGFFCHQHPSYKIYFNQYFNHSGTKVLSVF